MSQQISLYIDVQNRQLVRSLTSSVPASLPDVYQGDTLGLYLEFLDTTTTPSTDIDFSEASVAVGIGTIGAQPASGNFTITDPAASQTTGNIAYNASASAVQTAIQAALTTHWSAATVTGNAGGPYTITNGTNGSETALIGTSVSLTPTSVVSVGTSQAGTSSLPQIHYVRLLQSPIAYQDSWTAYPAPTATVTRLQAGSGTANEIQQITLGNNPYSGAFVVNFGSGTSNPIQYNATAAAVQTALQAMPTVGSGNVSVGGSAGAWVVTFTGTLALASQSLMTTVATGLIGPLALTGTLSLNTAGVEEAIGEADSITQTFGIQVTPDGESPFTCLQDEITIYNDLIVGAPSVPTPTASYYTEAQSDARYPILSSGHVTVADGGTGVGTLTGIVKGNGTSAFSAATAGTDYVAPTGSGAALAFPGTLSIASGKTFTASHTLTLTGTDASTLNIGTGGTLGTGAYASAYSLPDATTSVLGGMIVGTGLGVSSGTVSVSYGSSSGTAAQGNDSRITGALQNTYGMASGTNTYTATLSPAPASYTTGFITTIMFANANTGASTLNLNSLGATTIQLNGSALTTGQIVANSTIQLVYDGTYFQIIT